MEKENQILEFEGYQIDHVPLFQAMYGDGLISLGGLNAIDNMFSGLDFDLKKLKALDIGFGLGGVAFYLAEKYQMNITGIEIYSWMEQYAKEHTPQEIAHRVQFCTYCENGEFPFDVKSKMFDLVYSKGVFNHIREKNPLLCQIQSVLKPGGFIVIADWIFPNEMMKERGPLVCETKESYEKVLEAAGFGQISFRDDSQLFLNYTAELLSNLTTQREFIEKMYGREGFSVLWQEHEELMKKIKQNQKMAVRIVAKKIE